MIAGTKPKYLYSPIGGGGGDPLRRIRRCGVRLEGGMVAMRGSKGKKEDKEGD